MSEEAVTRWRELCLKFYTSEDDSMQSIIGAFESLAPQSEEVVIAVGAAGAKQTFLAALAQHAIHFDDLDDNLWYQLYQVKNEARSQAHLIMAEQRSYRLRQAIESLPEPPFDVDPGQAVGMLRALVRQHARNLQTIPFFSSLALVLRTQIGEPRICSLLVHETVLSEPGDAFEQQALALLNHIFRMSRTPAQHDPAMLVMDLREELSDPSLHRLLRCIPATAQQKTPHATSNFQVDTNPGTERTNITGEQDGTVCPYWLQRTCGGICPIL